MSLSPQAVDYFTDFSSGLTTGWATYFAHIDTPGRDHNGQNLHCQWSYPSPGQGRFMMPNLSYQGAWQIGFAFKYIATGVGDGTPVGVIYKEAWGEEFIANPLVIPQYDLFYITVQPDSTLAIIAAVGGGLITSPTIPFMQGVWNWFEFSFIIKELFDPVDSLWKLVTIPQGGYLNGTHFGPTGAIGNQICRSSPNNMIEGSNIHIFQAGGHDVLFNDFILSVSGSSGTTYSPFFGDSKLGTCPP